MWIMYAIGIIQNLSKSENIIIEQCYSIMFSTALKIHNNIIEQCFITRILKHLVAGSV